MSDVYLWAAYAFGAVLVASAVVAVVRRLIDRLDRRRYRPPVYPGISLPPARASLDHPTQVLRFVGRAPVRRRLTLPSLALLVDFIAQEAAVQRAMVRQNASIWAEVDGMFTAKGLRTA